MTIKSVALKKNIIGYVFLLPALLFLSAFMFYPVINSLVMSFTNWSGFSNNFKVIGIKNYVRLINNIDYWQAIVVNLKFALYSTLLQTVLGFILAFTIFHLSQRWQNFYKVALYLPVILPAAVVGVMWTFIYTPDFGLINQSLRAIGLGGLAQSWLGSYKTALGSVITTNTWRYVGFTMILYYVTMQNISKDVLEASTIDGATRAKQLFHIFIPLTWGTTEINFILSMIGGMKSFDLFYLMTGGGPGSCTQVVGMLIYRTAFLSFRFSQALAMSIVLFVLILILTTLSRILLKKYNYEEV